jgi:hypothetical protein
MAVTAKPYGSFLLQIGQAKHDFLTDTHNVALFTSAYTPQYPTDATYTDISANEVADGGGGTNYAVGGAALSNTAWSYDSITGVVTFNADPLTWATLSGTFRYAVVYKSSGTDKLLIGCFDFGENLTYNSEQFQMTFTNGVMTITGGV